MGAAFHQDVIVEILAEYLTVGMEQLKMAAVCFVHPIYPICPAFNAPGRG